MTSIRSANNHRKRIERRRRARLIRDVSAALKGFADSVADYYRGRAKA